MWVAEIIREAVTKAAAFISLENISVICEVLVVVAVTMVLTMKMIMVVVVVMMMMTMMMMMRDAQPAACRPDPAPNVL